MKRKRRSEIVCDFLHIDDAELMMLRGQLARFAMDNTRELSEARPTVPDGFQNRLAGNWRPLFAVADLCGGDWPTKARAAAGALSKEDAVSLYVQALAAIKAIFDARAGRPHVLSGYCGRLVGDRGWALEVLRR
jgi:Protein of unknown function (DUF3631)